jgi:hypothetical protein
MVYTHTLLLFFTTNSTKTYIETEIRFEIIEQREEMRSTRKVQSYFDEENEVVVFSDQETSDIHIIVEPSTTIGKCLPMFYLSNKKFAIIKYRFGLMSFF